MFIGRHVEYGNGGATVEVYGLFRAVPGDRGSIAVTRLDVTGTPADVFEHEGHCYALTNRANGARFGIAIYESSDGRSWTERASFPADAMGRSAEVLDGYVYVGLGCDLGSCSSAAGQLLRVRPAL